MRVAQCRLTKCEDILRIDFPSSIHMTATAYVTTVYDAEKIIKAWYGDANFVDFLDTTNNTTHKCCLACTERLHKILFSILFDGD